MNSTAVTVTTAATMVCLADDKPRIVYLKNSGGAAIYIGGASVTTANGYPLENNASVTIEIPTGEKLYGIVNAGTNVVNILTPDAD